MPKTRTAPAPLRRAPGRALARVQAVLSPCILMLLLALGGTAAHAEETSNPCGPIYMRHYGPFDYRTQRDKLAIVDEYHFTPQVEALIKGESSYIGGDLTYTLRASPNHHRALIAATRLAEKTKPALPEGMAYSVDCIYDRAVRFAPDDIIVRALFARFLNKKGDKPGAKRQLAAATTFAKDDGFSHYNIGLMYVEIGLYDEALAEAWRAQSLGFDRTELAEQLRRAGKWREPTTAEAAAAAASAPIPPAAGASTPAAAPASAATARATSGPPAAPPSSPPPGTSASDSVPR